jgi:hypothetical protein
MRRVLLLGEVNHRRAGRCVGDDHGLQMVAPAVGGMSVLTARP